MASTRDILWLGSAVLVAALIVTACMVRVHDETPIEALDQFTREVFGSP